MEGEGERGGGVGEGNELLGESEADLEAFYGWSADRVGGYGLDLEGSSGAGYSVEQVHLHVGDPYFPRGVQVDNQV